MTSPARCFDSENKSKSTCSLMVGVCPFSFQVTLLVMLERELCFRVSGFLSLSCDHVLLRGKSCETKKHEAEKEQMGFNRRVGSDSHKFNDGHMANQEGPLGEGSVMCAGEWL